MNERRDDWHTGVDEALITLKTAQRVTDDQLDDLELKYEAIDRVIRGNFEEETAGFAERLHALEDDLRERRATRVKGQVADVEIRKSKWEFAREITKQLLIAAVALILGFRWDSLETLFLKIIHQKPAPLEQAIDQAKRPRGKKIYRVRVVPPSDDTKESPQKSE